MSKRNRREHGRILSVETKNRGDSLADDFAAGVTSITVNDAGDFDEDGGWLYIGAQTVEYLDCDDDTGVITLADPLAAAAEQGDPVSLWSDLYGEVVDYQLALVELDGEYDNPDPVAAEVAEAVGDLPEGDRGKGGESCTLKRVSEDEWEVVGVGGRPRQSQSIRFEQDDTYTLTAADITAGSAVLSLTHRPIDEALTCVLAGVPQPPTEWTIDYNAQTLTVPLSGWEQVGDRLWVHYACRQGIATAVINSIVTVEIPWNGVVGTSSLACTGGHTAVGTGAILADGSDSTYVNYSGANGEGATSSLALPTTTIPATGFTAYADWKTTYSGLASETFNVIVNQAAYGNVGGWYYNHTGAESRVTDLGGGWKRFELEFPNGQGAFAQFVNGGSATAAVNCLGPAGKVHEAKLVVTWDTAAGGI